MKIKPIIRMYAVVWKDSARRLYGVPARDRIVSVEGKDKEDGLAIFSTKKEAVLFNNGNKDWSIRRVNILLSN